MGLAVNLSKARAYKASQLDRDAQSRGYLEFFKGHM